MSAPAILDTSVFIAAEQERAISRPMPDELAVSVVTLAELELGVLTARDTQRGLGLTGSRHDYRDS